MLSKKRIEKVMDTEIRPALKEHFGDIELSYIEGDRVYVKMLGQCSTCASAQYTVEDLVEKVLREHFPEIGKVEIDRRYDAELFSIAKKILNKEIDLKKEKTD